MRGYVFYEIRGWEKSSEALTSAVLSKPKNPNQCLRFFYFVPYTVSSRGLLVRIIRYLEPGSKAPSQLNATAEQRTETLWNPNAALLPQRWAPVEVRYTATDKYKLNFFCDSTVASGKNFYCAIDDIEVYPCGDKKGKQSLSCILHCNLHEQRVILKFGGKFIYVENKAKNTTIKATLLSPPLQPDWVGAACLSFWHFAVMEHMSSCNLTILSANESVWWSGSQQLKRSWNQEVVRIWLQEGKQKRDSVIDLKFAVQVLSTVWAQIQPGIVKNCFRKAGFRVDSDCTDCLPQEEQPDPGVWSAVEEAFGSQQFSDYGTADDDLVSSEQLTDEEIVAQIRQVPNAEQEEEQNKEGNSGIVTEEVTTSQALDYIQGLKNYFEQQATTSDEMNTLVMMETLIVSEAVRHTVQAKLTSFFQNI
ncbi:hypothetical protein MRX96_016531 [Rhipicephalus microplus]